MTLTKSDLQAIQTAISLISQGDVSRVDLGHSTIVYKVSSISPKKYTIRMDIKIDEEE